MHFTLVELVVDRLSILGLFERRTPRQTTQSRKRLFDDKLLLLHLGTCTYRTQGTMSVVQKQQ
jgi:hypothetical protein